MRAQCQHVFHRGSSVRIQTGKRETLETLQKPVAVSAHFPLLKLDLFHINGAQFLEIQYCARFWGVK